ncbi:MAG: threonine aldolase family protein [Fimbriimonadaceae bacterium]
MIADLRSDTVTKPTPEMLQAMITATVGDDVLGDDPTVQALEQKIVSLTGMEAAVFVPSGTMGNQIGIASLTQPGDSILVEDEAHILHYEVGALAVLNGLTVRSLRSENGTPTESEIRAKNFTFSLHTPGTTLLCLENTHNRHGGSITPPETQAQLRTAANNLGIKVHLDGARLWNAAAALNRPIIDFTKHVDSVSLCLSKGLGAPVGSVLAGTHDHIEKARIWRKRLGGGMRQSGLLAAAGIYAIDHHFNLLHLDHTRSKKLSEFINLETRWSSPIPQTNIAMLDIDCDPMKVVENLEAKSVRAYPFGPKRIRFVFHHQVNDEMLEQTCLALREISLG